MNYYKSKIVPKSMLNLEEILMITNKIIDGVRQKYSSADLPLNFNKYESTTSERIRQGLFTEDLQDVTAFTNQSKDTTNNSLVKSLDYVLSVLKKEFSSMPEDNKQMRRALKLIAKWSALATLGYENTEEAKSKTIELVTDFCTGYNRQAFLPLVLSTGI